jgi:hypothetical protein
LSWGRFNFLDLLPIVLSGLIYAEPFRPDMILLDGVTGRKILKSSQDFARLPSISTIHVFEVGHRLEF